MNEICEEKKIKLSMCLKKKSLLHMHHRQKEK